MCRLEFSLTFFFFLARIYETIVVHKQLLFSSLLFFSVLFFFSVEGSSLWCLISLEQSSHPADFEKFEKCFAW